TRRQRVEHDRAHSRHKHCVEDGARPDEMNARRLAALAFLHVDVGVVSDEALGPANLGHDLIASVDAQRAIDAFKLITVADIDAWRTNGDALAAIDAITAPLPALVFLVRPARLATIGAIGHRKRVLVGHRRLNTRPGTHISADLLAHRAGERV